jgi:hypothetical protein
MPELNLRESAPSGICRNSCKASADPAILDFTSNTASAGQSRAEETKFTCSLICLQNWTSPAVVSRGHSAAERLCQTRDTPRVFAT